MEMPHWEMEIIMGRIRMTRIKFGSSKKKKRNNSKQKRCNGCGRYM